MLINGKEAKNLIIGGEIFTKSYDDLIGKKMVIDNYGFGNNNVIIKFDDGSEEFAYDPYDKTQTDTIDYYRMGSDNDKLFPGLWLGGKIKTSKNTTGSKNAWVKASDVTIA